MIHFEKWSIADIKKRTKNSNDAKLKKLHSTLYRYIGYLGTRKRKPNGHGNDLELTIGSYILRMDDYNAAISINGKQIGINFGGFDCSINAKTYKYFIGRLYQEWLKRKILT